MLVVVVFIMVVVVVVLVVVVVVVVVLVVGHTLCRIKLGLAQGTNHVGRILGLAWGSHPGQKQGRHRAHIPDRSLRLVQDPEPGQKPWVCSGPKTRAEA